jgi:hypothetical protein
VEKSRARGSRRGGTCDGDFDTIEDWADISGREIRPSRLGGEMPDLMDRAFAQG